MSDYCSRCGKPLKNLKSRSIGIGPECLKQHNKSITRRPLFDMSKSNRNKKRKVTQRNTFNKEEKEIINEVIQQSVGGYTAAVLLTIRDKLSFGPKRAQQLASDIQETFDAIQEGRISIDDAKQTVLDELGIKIK